MILLNKGIDPIDDPKKAGKRDYSKSFPVRDLSFTPVEDSRYPDIKRRSYDSDKFTYDLNALFYPAKTQSLETTKNYMRDVADYARSYYSSPKFFDRWETMHALHNKNLESQGKPSVVTPDPTSDINKAYMTRLYYQNKGQAPVKMNWMKKQDSRIKFPVFYEDARDKYGDRVVKPRSFTLPGTEEKPPRILINARQKLTNPILDSKEFLTGPDVTAHEVGHAFAKKGFIPRTVQETLRGMQDKWYKTNVAKDPNYPKLTEHDRSASETKSDIDALRYMFFKTGIYDTRSGDFNKGLMKEGIKAFEDKNYFMNRLRRLYSDDDIIWMMNNIAANKPITNKYSNIA